VGRSIDNVAKEDIMDEELDNKLDRDDDQSFYRGSFGEKISRDDEDEPVMADTDADVVSDEADEDEDDLEPVVEAAPDEDFRETLDEADPMTEPAGMDDPGSDFEDKSASGEDMTTGEKIREKYNNLNEDEAPEQ